MKTIILIIMLSASVSHSKELTLDQFTTIVSNEAEEAGEYELDASEVCDFYKNQLTTKQKQECETLESESDNGN